MNTMSPYEQYGEFKPESDANLQEYVFKSTDTISNLAHKFYGDWRLWRVICDRTKIVDPRKIPVGTLLLIPKRPLDKEDSSLGK